MTTPHASGTLTIALDLSPVSTVIVTSALGQNFDRTAALVVGGTTIELGDSEEHFYLYF